MSKHALLFCLLNNPNQSPDVDDVPQLDVIGPAQLPSDTVPWLNATVFSPAMPRFVM